MTANTLNDDNFNKNIDVNKIKNNYCQENSTYHNTDYFWCINCKKVYCSNCIFLHLQNNQINHNNINNVFLKKEELDIEFQRNSEKLKIFQNFINKCLDRYKGHLSELNILNQLLTNCDKYMNKFCQLFGKLREEFRNKLERLKNYNDSTLIKNKENMAKSNLQKIYLKMNNIKVNYYENKNFEPSKMQNYYNDLKDCHKEYLDLYSIFSSDIDKNNINFINKNGSNDINSENVLNYNKNCFFDLQYKFNIFLERIKEMIDIIEEKKA